MTDNSNKDIERVEIKLSPAQKKKYIEYAEKEGFINRPGGYGLATFIKRAVDTVIAQKIPLSLISRMKSDQKEEVVDYFQELKELVVSMKSRIDSLVTKEDLEAIIEQAINYELAVEKIINILQQEPALVKKSTAELTKILKKEDPRLTPFLEKTLEYPFTALEAALAKIKQQK